MDEICTGTEQNDWNLRTSHPGEQLEIDGANTSFTLTADRLVKIEVQLGNAASQLNNTGGILAIIVKVRPQDTGDECVMPQKQLRLTALDRLALISVDPFWAKSGSVIKVFAKSSNAGDTTVGGMVWIYDIAPQPTGSGASAAEMVTALMADTGFTAGGTMTYEELMKLLAGMVAGTWRDKPGDSTKQELLDADDDSTILLEILLATSTPYKQVTIK